MHKYHSSTARQESYIDVDIRQLRYYLAIARCGSFSRAANELNVAQPALSHHVANLEAELGVRLLDRSTKGVIATECGETLITHAEIIITQMDKAARDVQNTSANPSGVVSIGLPTSISIGLTVPLLHEVETRYPAIDLKISENHSGYLIDWLSTGRLDLAVLFDVDEQLPLDAHHLFTETLYYLSALGTFPPEQTEIALCDVADKPLILTGENHGLRHVIDKQSKQNSLDIDVKTELDSLVAIKHMVIAGYGHSILPWYAISEEVREGKLQALHINPPQLERSVSIVSSREWVQSRATELICDLVQEMVKDLIKTDVWRGVEDKALNGHNSIL